MTRAQPAGTTMSAMDDRGAGHEVTVRVLGPFEFEVDGHPVAVAPKERMLLSALALREGRTMHLHEMATALWADLPPATLRKCVQAHVSRVRRRLERVGVSDSGAVLLTAGDGYALAVDARRVDATRFEHLVDAGRRDLATADFDRAVEQLQAARDLWRGEPLLDLAETPVGQAERARLIELRLSGIEALFDGALALGRHGEVAGEIEAALADHPLRENLWGQLMLSLYRSGRQAEALRAYQRARTTLVDQLGIEPGPGLRRLEGAIVGQDPSLDLFVDPSIDRGVPSAHTAGWNPPSVPDEGAEVLLTASLDRPPPSIHRRRWPGRSERGWGRSSAVSTRWDTSIRPSSTPVTAWSWWRARATTASASLGCWPRPPPASRAMARSCWPASVSTMSPGRPCARPSIAGPATPSRSTLAGWPASAARCWRPGARGSATARALRPAS